MSWRLSVIRREAIRVASRLVQPFCEETIICFNRACSLIVVPCRDLKELFRCTKCRLNRLDDFLGFKHDTRSRYILLLYCLLLARYDIFQSRVRAFRSSLRTYKRSYGQCLLLLLRIRSAHLEILGIPIAGAYRYRDNFARFKTMQRKQNVAICCWCLKRKVGVSAHFPEIIKF